MFISTVGCCRSVDPIFSIASSLKASELKTITKNMLSLPESDSKTSDETNHPDGKIGKCQRLYKRKIFTSTNSFPPQCSKASSSNIFMNRPSQKFSNKRLATDALKMQKEPRNFRNFAEELKSDTFANDCISGSNKVASSGVFLVKQLSICAQNGSKDEHSDQNENSFLYCPSTSRPHSNELTNADVKLVHDTGGNGDLSSTSSGPNALHQSRGFKSGLPLDKDESKQNSEVPRDRNCLFVDGIDSRTRFDLLQSLFRISNERANGCVVNSCFTHRIVMSGVNKEVQVDSLDASDANMMMTTDIEYVTESKASKITQEVSTAVQQETYTKSFSISLRENDGIDISELMPNLVNLDCFKLRSLPDDIQRSCRCFVDTLLHTPQSGKQQHSVKIGSETKKASRESCGNHRILSDLKEMHCTLFDTKQQVYYLVSNPVPTLSSANIWSTESSVHRCESVIPSAEFLRLVHSYCQQEKLCREDYTKSSCSAEMLAGEEKSSDILAERKEMEELEMHSPEKTLICLSRGPLSDAECVGPKNDIAQTHGVDFSSSIFAFNCDRDIGCTVNLNSVKESPAVAIANQDSFIQQRNDSNAASMPGWFGKGLGARKLKRRRAK